MAFNFTDKILDDENTALVVDALNLAFRWKHQGRTDLGMSTKKQYILLLLHILVLK